MAEMQEPEIQFAQRLASNEKPTRTKALKKLRKYVCVRSHENADGFTVVELLKLWKGLFYCLWMQDKLLLQEELSTQISTLIHSFQSADGQFLYLESFLLTIKREWTGIDRLRMDKFFQLVRFMFRQTFEMLKRKNWDSSVVSRFLDLLASQVLHSSGGAPTGLQFHILDLYMTELAAVGSAELAAHQNLTFIEPFCKAAAKTKDRTLFAAICSSIFSSIIDQAPFAIEDLMKEVKATEASDSDSGQASEEEEEKEEQAIKEEKKRKRKKGVEKQINGKKLDKDDEEADDDEDDDGLLHLEDSDTEPGDEEYGAVLQFDYSALADKLMDFSSRNNTPSRNRQRLYGIIKVLRDLTEGVFPQDEYPEEVSTDEDDEMFGSRKRMKRGKNAWNEDDDDDDDDEEEAPAAKKKKKGKKKKEAAVKPDGQNDGEPAEQITNDKKKKKKRRKKKKKAAVSSTEAEKAAEPSSAEPSSVTSVEVTGVVLVEAKRQMVTVSQAADQSEALSKEETSEVPTLSVQDAEAPAAAESEPPAVTTETLADAATTEEKKDAPAEEDASSPFTNQTPEETETPEDAAAMPAAKKSKKKMKKKKPEEAEPEAPAAAEAEVVSISSDSSQEVKAESDPAEKKKKKGQKKAAVMEAEEAAEATEETLEEATATTPAKKKKNKRKSLKAELEAPEVTGEGTDAEIASDGAEVAAEQEVKMDKDAPDLKPEATPLSAAPAADPSAATPLKKKRKKTQKAPKPEEEAQEETPQEVEAEECTPEITMTTPGKKKNKRGKAAETEEAEGDDLGEEPTVVEIFPDNEAASSSSVKKTKKKKRKIPVVIEFEADEVEEQEEASLSEESTGAKKTKLGREAGESSTPLSAKKLQKKKKARASSSSASPFITFQSKCLIPTPLFFKTRKGAVTPKRKKLANPQSESKKVTFGLKNNKTAEFKKTDRSLLVSPDGSSRVPFDPQQKPKFGVLKSPSTPIYGGKKALGAAKKKATPTAQATPTRRPTAADFF
ncbi:uncharacterized protein rrp1 [Genypterus blacodes]|uniref:uncharacterized protein rrp1 n=1 Tax=Genypterus blacodes TaxID=154954 RepID=UPI003F771A32